MNDILSEWARTFWFSARLTFLCREGAQALLYAWLTEELLEDPSSVRPLVWKCHRRLGKSFLLLLLLVERCLSRPGQRCVYGAPTYEQVAAIVIPNLAILLRTCPPELLPRESGRKFWFRNPAWGPGAQPSLLHLVGTNFHRGNLLRGPYADAVGLDEVREMPDLRYLVEDVLLYQFAKRVAPWLLLVSTMPASADHEFESYFVPAALRTGRYVEVPTTANPGWTADDDTRLLESIGGGKDSISWRREALCEAVSDETELIVPEFQRHQASVVVSDYARPSHFYAHSCLDTGWTDWNAVLFGYVDFRNRVLVVEDELVLRYESTGTIARGIDSKEHALWQTNGVGSWHYGHAPTRMGDLTEQALTDLRIDHKMFVRPAEKWNREAAIANLRTGIQDGHVRIHERCKNLIYQLKNGTWNKARTQFQRSPRIGHCDALAALVYLYRMANWNGNPFPDPVKRENFGDMFETPTKKPMTRYDALVKAIGR